MIRPSTTAAADPWKGKYGGADLDELRRLKELEQENSRLKNILASQTLKDRLYKKPGN